MDKSFYQVQLLHISACIEEEVSSLSFDFGALGISENLSFDNITENKILDIYFEARPAQEYFNQISEIIPSDKIKTFELENKDWLTEWKKSYHAFPLVDDIWIVPSWETKENVNQIFIDPGMAFGTGTHQTTQICAELISEVLRNFRIDTMLDVGTGTGILSILARKLGVKNVIGTEIDSESVITARENLAINRIHDIQVFESNLGQINGKFDLIVANIMDTVLLDLKKDFLRLSKRNTCFIFSGILQERDAEFIKNYLSDIPLNIVSRIQKDEWVGYYLK